MQEAFVNDFLADRSIQRQLQSSLNTSPHKFYPEQILVQSEDESIRMSYEKQK